MTGAEGQDGARPGATAPRWSRAALAAMIGGAIAVAIAFGVRQSMGVFTQPVSLEIGDGRAAFAFAIALQNLLFGVAQPFVGAIADRWGAGRVMVAGAALYALGLTIAAMAQDPLGLHVSLGVLVGLGLSGTTYVTVLGVVGRLVPPERRSIAFGLVTAAGSFGMFAMVPGAQGLIDWLDWRGALWVMVVLVSVLAATALGVRGRSDNPAAGSGELGFRATLALAARYRSYWYLVAGFFVCGFHIAFVAVHLTPYLTDGGIGLDVAVQALALIGLANIAGSYLFGQWGQRHSKRLLLAGIYAARGVTIVVFVLVPLSEATALAFGLVFGFLWLATVPLTSGLVATMFGTRYLSTLYGFVFFSHQVGSFLGAWLGGIAHDALGSYDAVWWASVALALFAAAIHWPIREVPAGLAERRPVPA
ncbi:MAG: MFS transporter [Azospirillaceae bacterium]